MTGDPALASSERAALRAFLDRLRALPDIDVTEARLFGSRARGEGHEHSDLDVAVVLASDARRHRYRIYDLAYDIGLAHGVQLAPLVLDEARLAELRSRERRLATVLETEGIPL
jgi:uncharacterized protein